MRLSEETVALVFEKWRATRRPAKMRRAGAVGITKSTSRVLEFTCICGARVTCCNAYARTKRVRDFIEAHDLPCALTDLTDLRWRG